MIVGIIAGLPESLIWFRGPLIRDLIEAGWSVVCFGPPAGEPVVAKIEAMGVRYQPIRIARKGTKVFADLATFWDLYRGLKKANATMVLSYTIKPVIYGTLAARLAGIERCFSIITGLGVVYTQTGLKQKILRLITDFLYRISLPLNRVVFFQNPDDRNLFSSRRLLSRSCRSKVVSGSGVDLDAFPYSPITGGPPRFVLIGRLLASKGIREFTSAATKISERYPAAHFMLVGLEEDGHIDAIDRKEIEIWFEKNPNFQFSEWGVNVRSVLESATVYVLPSYREGTPRSVLEAMAVGRPIITTDAPGCRETVENERNGFLVPVEDVDQLVEAMERFILDESLAKTMGRESRRMVEERFDVKLVNHDILTAMNVLSD